MFIGHYAVSLALKSADKKVSLGWLFIAVQFVDIIFFPLTLLGIEKFNLIENYTESTHFQLEYMPYTHSLVAGLFWACIAFIIFGKSKYSDYLKSLNPASLLAIAVLSHWFLDLIVHTPDLPILTDDSLKLGFGLWNNAMLTYIIEAVILLFGLWLYMKNTIAVSKGSNIAMPIFVIFLLLINVINIFGNLSPEDTPESVAISASFHAS